MTVAEAVVGAGTLAGGVVAGAALLVAAFLLTVATFTSTRSLIARPLSTLPTEPIDMDAPPGGRRRPGRHTASLRHAMHAMHAALDS